MGSDPLATAADLHRRAVAEQNAGRPAQALRLLQRALQQVDVVHAADGQQVTTLSARIWISIAVNECDLHGIAAGREALAKVETFLRANHDPAVAVAMHNQAGLIELRSGDLGRAFDAFDAGASLIASATAHDRFNILLNRGVLRLTRNDLRGARADLNSAAEAARQATFAVGELKALHNLAYVEFLAGDIPRALRLMEAAGDLRADVSYGIWYLDRARVLLEAGLHREADESLSDAARVFRTDRQVQDLGETELERARCALLMGDVAGARRLAARARDRFRRRGNDRWRRSAELVLLMGDLAAGRPGRRLIGPALRLRQEFQSTGMRLPARTAALIAAEAHLNAGQVAGAADVLSGTGRATENDPITARLHDRYVRARLSAARGRNTEASRTVARGLADLAAHQARFGSADASAAAAVLGRQLAELDLALALDTASAAGVFAAAERTRAVTNRLPAVVPPEDPQVARLLAELRQTIDAQRAAEDDAAALRRRRRELERAITQRGWTRTGAGAARPPAELSEVIAALGESALVMYLQSGHVLHAVTVDRGHARVRALGPADEVNELARRVRADLDVLAQPRLPVGLRAAVIASSRRTLAQLDRSLLAPLGLAGRRLVVVSTGVLGQLPWGLLPGLRGVPVVVAPSATAWLTAADASAPRRRFTVTALAGPDLDRAHHEAAGVAAVWAERGTLADGDVAGCTGALAHADLLHVAAHGLHQTENPLFSSVRLADGDLFAHELDRHGSTPGHVVLSACELGLATVRPGDEALGLMSVLLRLGTRSVVAGVARIGDELAEAAMLDYHRRLAGGADSATALAGALASAGDPVPLVCFGSAWSAPGAAESAGFGARRRRRVP